MAEAESICDEAEMDNLENVDLHLKTLGTRSRKFGSRRSMREHGESMTLRRMAISYLIHGKVKEKKTGWVEKRNEGGKIGKRGKRGIYSSTRLVHKDKLMLRKRLASPTATLKTAVCEVCGDNFRQTSSKNRHVRLVHNNERKYACVNDRCERWFKTADAAKTHNKAVHLKIKDNRCTYCEARFSTRWNMRKHEKTLHATASCKGNMASGSATISIIKCASASSSKENMKLGNDAHSHKCIATSS